MAFSLNRITIIGNVGKEPEIRFTPSGMAIAEFSVAVNDRRKKGDEWVDDTEWFTCKAFDKSAELVGKMLHRGSKVYVEGRMKTRSWDDEKSGTKRYKTELLMNTFIPLDGRPTNGSSSAGDMDEAPAPTTEPAAATYSDDDLPF